MGRDCFQCNAQSIGRFGSRIDLAFGNLFGVGRATARRECRRLQQLGVYVGAALGRAVGRAVDVDRQGPGRARSGRDVQFVADQRLWQFRRRAVLPEADSAAAADCRAGSPVDRGAAQRRGPAVAPSCQCSTGRRPARVATHVPRQCGYRQQPEQPDGGHPDYPARIRWRV